MAFFNFVFSLRSRRLEVEGTRKNGRARVSPSRAPVLSFAHYFQAPATQAILSRVFMTTVVVPLSAFLRFISVSRFRALRASRSAGGRLFFGFVISISARSLLTSSK